MSNQIMSNNKKVCTKDQFVAMLKKKGLQKPQALAPTTAGMFANRLVDLDVDTPSLVNRPTVAKNLVKILASMNGFDGKVWNPPKAARLPDGKIYLYDGDHSRHLYKHYHPKAKTMPAFAVDVKDKAEIHHLFVQANCKGRTGITAQQIFVHNVLANDPKDTRINELLKKSKLKIFCSNEPGGTQGDIDGYEVKIGGAKRCLAIEQVVMGYKNKPVKQAVELLVECLPAHHVNNGKSLPVELLGGLTFLLGAYDKELAVGTHARVQLKNLLVASQTSFGTISLATEYWKKKGGNHTNSSEYCIAQGIRKQINQNIAAYGLQKKLPGGVCKMDGSVNVGSATNKL